MNTARWEKARNMRYKRSVLAEINFDTIVDELYGISEQCDNVRYFMSDDETLLNALDGDEEEFEIKMMFSELDCECERLIHTLRDIYITEHFDDFFVGLMGRNGMYNVLGYDTYEEDYFTLTEYEERLAENESAKRLMRLTKQELISIASQCFGVAMSYYNVRYKYDYLKSALTFCVMRIRHF